MNIQVGLDPWFGVLTVFNESCYEYKQVTYKGEVMDIFTVNTASSTESNKTNPTGKTSSNEKTIAIVVMICSLAFLCYFIYSWVSCYMKKPKVRESEVPQHELENGDGVGEGYDMQPVSNVNVQ